MPSCFFIKNITCFSVHFESPSQILAFWNPGCLTPLSPMNYSVQPRARFRHTTPTAPWWHQCRGKNPERKKYEISCSEGNWSSKEVKAILLLLISVLGIFLMQSWKPHVPIQWLSPFSRVPYYNFLFFLPNSILVCCPIGLHLRYYTISYWNFLGKSNN